MDSTLEAPLFSIILPVYNGQRFISETVHSVIQQTFTNWELIIINDGSTDDTVSIIERFREDERRITLVHQSNKKQPSARNAGYKIAKGEWVAFIDADDIWLPEKLDVQYQYIKGNGKVDVFFSDGYTKFQDKLIRHYYHYQIVHGYFLGADLYKQLLLFGNCIPILSLIIKKNWIDRVGMQDETLAGVEDHDYCLRLCRAGATFYGLKERLFVYRVHNNNFSSDLENQYYLTSLMRIKNFDPLLLNHEETKKFRSNFKYYFQYFQRRNEWKQDVEAKFSVLNIPPVPVAEQITKGIWNLRINANRIFKIFLKKFIFILLKNLYFYPKKNLTYYKDWVASLYSKWLNSANIKDSGPIKLSPTASIKFQNSYSGSMDVQSIEIGDFSQLNFVTKDSKLTAGADVSIGKFCIFNILGQLVLGNNVLFNNHSTLTCHQEIVIGDNSWFGEGVRFYDHNHKYKERNIPFTQQGYANGKIEIGNNVWVGSNAVILMNVTIGDGCVIGANNVVSKSLPPNTLVKSKSMEIMDIIR
jgi:glycosyltransferase involved in cell wall biosynthesis